jgi:purine nucleosidase
MATRPIVIDTDPGQDDAVAILMALGAPDRLEVLGLSAVAGNVPLETTQRNARIVCEWAGRADIPVFAGCTRPLLRPPVWAHEVHGQEGIEGPELHQPSMPLQAEHAVGWLIRTLRTHPTPVTLCTLGPLTNIALALAQAPDIAGRIEQLVMMGGAHFESGNITPNAEFNLYVDPHAAEVVLACGAPIVVLPLDVTHQVLTHRHRVARLQALGNRAGRIAAQILQSYERAEADRFGGDGGPLHDPCVIGYLLAPHLFKGKRVNVTIETTSPLTLGTTVVDWWGRSGRAPNVFYVTGVDSEGFFELLTDCLSALP